MSENDLTQPMRRSTDHGNGSGERRTVEQWQELKKTPAIAFAAAKGLMGWVVGAEISEGDYDQAIDDAMNVRIG
jgi:hypothetical protein